MPHLTQSEIESIAQQVYRAYCDLPRFESEPVTFIDPEVLAKEMLNLNVEYHLLSVSGAILGLTARNKYKISVYDDGPQGQVCLLRKNTIFIDRTLRDTPELYGHYRFTLAHEVSHHIMWMQYRVRAARVSVKQRVYCRLAKYLDIVREEHYVNELTSAILMPHQLLLSKMAEYGLGTRIKELNRLYDRTGYRKFSEMAESLGVSKTVLCMRMKQLGLIERRWLIDTYNWPFA